MEKKPKNETDAPLGHNSGAAGGRLRSLVRRIERLEEGKRNLSADIKEVYGEAKGEGYDVKVLRKVVALRRVDFSKRQEEAALIELYLGEVGEVA